MGMNDSQRVLKTKAQNLFQNKRMYHEQIVVNKTHVFIGPGGVVRQLNNAMMNTQRKVTHMSQMKYMDNLVGIVYNRNLNKLVEQNLHDM